MDFLGIDTTYISPFQAFLHVTLAIIHLRLFLLHEFSSTLSVQRIMLNSSSEHLLMFASVDIRSLRGMEVEKF